MTDFGWTRLAYLLVVLSVLAVLVQLGSPSADPLPLAAEPPDGRTSAGDLPAARELHEREGALPRATAAPHDNPATPAFARHLKRATSGAPGVTASESGRAVFYRPAQPSPPPTNPAPEVGGPSRPEPVCGDLGRLPNGHRLVFPLPMQYASSYEDSWGAPRPQGGHEGTDLMAPTGTPEYAVTDGTIVPVAGSNGNGWNTLGGYALMLRAAYSVGPVREGDLFYYAHLDRESTLPLGATVRAGQLVGYAGDTGQGPEVTNGLFSPHLHFGWYDATGTRSYLPSGAMNPYPLLEWMKAGAGVLGGGTDARYCEVPRSGAPTSSTGDRWPTARDPGARPDLDTGSDEPTPSPAVGQRSRPQERRADGPKTTAPLGPQDGTPGKGSPRASAGAAPDPQAPRSSSPDPTPAGNPRKPATREELPPRTAPPEEGQRQAPPEQSTDDEPQTPVSTPGHEPPEEAGSRPPGGEKPEREEKDKGEEGAAKDPGGDPEGLNPEEKSAEDPRPPDEETAPDEDEPSPEEPGAGGDPESTTPETEGSDVPEEEGTAPETTTPG